MCELVEFCKEASRYTEAESILKRSNQILETLMDMGIVDEADAYDILADVCRAQGRLEDATWYEW